MSDSSEASWSDNPNAPKISNWVHFEEKVYFSASLIGAIFYGIVVILFFQCMSALLNTGNRARAGIKWGLVAHTIAMFSFVTIYTALSLNAQPISFVDNRGFPGNSDDGVLLPGPIGYQWSIRSKAISIDPTPMLVLNNWLADGLLLYRCYIVFAMNYWIIAFPCIMYLACFVMGIIFIYQTTRPTSVTVILDTVVRFGAPYFSITFPLNILLTFMIITRLVMHRKNIRNAMGTAAGVGRLYKAIITILIESSALYTISSLLYAVPWAARNSTQNIFLQIFAQTQVIAPFLITLRIANRRSLANDTTASGNVGSIRFNSEGRHPGNSEILPGRYPAVMSSMDAGEFGVGIETMVDPRQDRMASSSGVSLKS